MQMYVRVEVLLLRVARAYSLPIFDLNRHHLLLYIIIMDVAEDFSLLFLGFS